MLGLASGAGVEEPELFTGVRDRSLVPGEVALGGASNRRGESCEGCVLALVLDSSWVGCCIWTSTFSMGSPSVFGPGADVDRFLLDLSTEPPVP